QRSSVGQGPIGVATLDFIHDGLQEAVTANSVDGTLTFLKNMGNGVLQRDSDLAVGAGRLANGDLNADGLPDLVVGSATQGSVHVLLGSSGGLQPGATLYSAGLHNLIVDDMNQDGIPDIPVMTENREVLISNGLGGGNFTPLN
ncbi:MAG: FG-GAP repeat domain-containing protein, partial [Planctomyces sp.]